MVIKTLDMVEANSEQEAGAAGGEGEVGEGGGGVVGEGTPVEGLSREESVDKDVGTIVMKGDVRGDEGAGVCVCVCVCVCGYIYSCEEHRHCYVCVRARVRVRVRVAARSAVTAAGQEPVCVCVRMYICIYRYSSEEYRRCSRGRALARTLHGP